MTTEMTFTESEELSSDLTSLQWALDDLDGVIADFNANFHGMESIVISMKNDVDAIDKLIFVSDLRGATLKFNALNARIDAYFAEEN